MDKFGKRESNKFSKLEVCELHFNYMSFARKDNVSGIMRSTVDVKTFSMLSRVKSPIV